MDSRFEQQLLHRLHHVMRHSTPDKHIKMKRAAAQLLARDIELRLCHLFDVARRIAALDGRYRVKRRDFVCAWTSEMMLRVSSDESSAESVTTQLRLEHARRVEAHEREARCLRRSLRKDATML